MWSRRSESQRGFRVAHMEAGIVWYWGRESRSAGLVANGKGVSSLPMKTTLHGMRHRASTMVWQQPVPTRRTSYRALQVLIASESHTASRQLDAMPCRSVKATCAPWCLWLPPRKDAVEDLQCCIERFTLHVEMWTHPDGPSAAANQQQPCIVGIYQKAVACRDIRHIERE